MENTVDEQLLLDHINYVCDPHECPHCFHEEMVRRDNEEAELDLEAWEGMHY